MVQRAKDHFSRRRRLFQMEEAKPKPGKALSAVAGRPSADTDDEHQVLDLISPCDQFD